MMATEQSKIENVAQLGSSVLLDINDGDRMTFARLHSNSTLKIANVKCSLQALIGSPFGAVFEMHKAKLVRINPHASGADLYTDEGTDLDDKDELEITDEVREKDNRNLIDTNTAQTLSSNDIERMRKDGASGKQIIDALVANSSSFVQKTPFSQEKYMRKKQKKYAPRVILRRPSAWSICEAYFAKDPRKIGFCRMDTLALILSLGNVGANSDVLVLDSLGGLITAAVAERVGGHGSICNTYYNSKCPPMDMVSILNIDELTAKSVLRAPIASLLSARKGIDVVTEKSPVYSFQEETCSIAANAREPCNIADNTGEDSLSATLMSTNFTKESSFVRTISTEAISGDVTVVNGVFPHDSFGLKNMDNDDDSRNEGELGTTEYLAEKSTNFEPNLTSSKVKVKAARPGMQATAADIGRWASQGFTSLIVAAPELHPWTVAQQLLPLLSSSSPFVIYHSYQQPLAECMYQLQTHNLAVAVQLSEPWSREYQVLPSRTHPHMQMSATGGYALSGTYIVNCS